MNKIELVKTAYDLNNPEQYSYYADDFLYTDAQGGPPQDRATWLSMGKLMRSAFPDLSLVIDDIREEGDDVVVTGHFAGTFTNDFDVSPLGMGVVPATGKAYDFPPATNRVSFDGDKIAKMYGLDAGPDAGIAGFAKTLGVSLG